MTTASRLRLAALIAAGLAASASPASAQAPRAARPAKGNLSQQSGLYVIQKIDPKQQLIVVTARGGRAVQSQQTQQTPTQRQSPNQQSKGGKDAGGLVILINGSTQVRVLGLDGKGTDKPAPAPDQDGGKDKPNPAPAPDQDGGKDKPNPAPAPDQDGGKDKPNPAPAPDQDGGKDKPKPAPDQDGGKDKPKPAPDQDGGKPDQKARPTQSQFDKLKVDQLVQIFYQQQDDGALQAARIIVLGNAPTTTDSPLR